MGNRQIFPEISITGRAFLPWHTIKNKTKALYSTWEKGKKGERNFVYLWMALLKSQDPKQSQQTCSAALGHELTLQNAPKLSQPDISSGKKTRAETEQRECHMSAHSSWSKPTLSDLWHNTDCDLLEIQISYCPKETLLCSNKGRCALWWHQKALSLQALRCIVTAESSLFSP